MNSTKELVAEISEAYTTYYPELLRYAKRHFDESTAEDLVQQAFVELLRFQGQVLKIRSWLYKALVDQMSLKHRRKYRESRKPKARHRVLDETPYDIVAHLDHIRHVRQVVRQVLSKMKLHLRAAALDVLLEGYSRSEAADRHNISQDTVAWAVKMARKRIKRALATEINTHPATECTSKPGRPR